MRLVTYQIQRDIRIGAMIDDKIVDLAQAFNERFQAVRLPDTLIGLLQADDAAYRDQSVSPLSLLQEAVDYSDTTARVALNAVTLLPPVLNPEKVVCLGLNYRAHASETKKVAPDFPMLFHKTAGSLLGAGGAIRIPSVTQQVDYEGELAVIIGRTCYNVSAENALNYVAGYTCANDVSARDWQYRTKQFTQGKMLDTFGPLGPALVTRDEIPNPHNLRIRTILNGNVMQDGHTSAMIFDVPFIVSYISQIATLKPGDVILTGTPEGVGFARDPQVFLQPGDSVTVEIEQIGTLTNSIVAY